MTESNSSAPETEQAIVAEHSYGRQLGRIIDAVAVLIEERPEGAAGVPAFECFEELRREVDAIKTRLAVKRIERAITDLTQLKETHAEEYQRLEMEFRGALEGQSSST